MIKVFLKKSNVPKIMILIIIIAQKNYHGKDISYSHQINLELTESSLGSKEKETILIVTIFFLPHSLTLPFSHSLPLPHPFSTNRQRKYAYIYIKIYAIICADIRTWCLP